MDDNPCKATPPSTCPSQRFDNRPNFGGLNIDYLEQKLAACPENDFIPVRRDELRALCKMARGRATVPQGGLVMSQDVLAKAKTLQDVLNNAVPVGAFDAELKREGYALCDAILEQTAAPAPPTSPRT